MAYNINQPTEPKAWNGEAYSLSIFGTIEFLEINAENIYISLLCIADFIRKKKVQLGSFNNISQLKGFGKATWNLISSIYESNWNTADIDNNNSFRNKVSSKFTPKVLKTKTLSNFSSSKNKTDKIVKLPPPIIACLPKEVLEKSKFSGKGKKPVTMNKTSQNRSYTQVAGSSVLEILKLKEKYPNLPAIKIENIQKIINNSGKSKPYIRITTKDPFCKQIIISISKENTKKLMAFASNHIANINRALKNIKSDIIADYVWQKSLEVIIVTNKIASSSDI